MTDTANLQIKVSSTGVEKATNDLEKLTKTSLRTEKRAKQSSAALGGVGRSAGQAGIQIQQFVGQVQGGQSAMLALSQQGADLGFVLGAPLVGAIVGIGASLIGMTTGLGKAKSAIELLEIATQEFDETLKRSDKGVLTFSKALQELAGTSEVLARIKIATGIEKGRKAIDTAIDGIEEKLGDLPRALRPSLGGVSDAFVAVGGDITKLKTNIQAVIESGQQTGLGFPELAKARDNINALQREFGLSEAQASKLAVAMSEVQSNANPLSIGQFQNAIEDIAQETGFSNTKLNEFAETMIPFIRGVSNGVDQVNALTLALAHFKKAKSETGETGGILGEDIIPQSKETLIYFKLLEQARASTLGVIAKEDTAIQRLTSQLNYYTIANQEGAEAAFKFLEAQRQGYEDFESLPSAMQAQIDKLYELKEAQQGVKESTFDLTQAITENVVQGVGDATATALVEMESLGEGLKNVARGAIKQAISGLVQLGINRLIQSKMNIAATTAETAAVTAQGAAISAAMTPAAAATTIATGGTNLAAAQALMPSFTAMFSTMMAASSTPVARAAGGDLQIGSNSYVAENGMEVFMPNQNGRVFNKNDVQEMMKGGSGGQNVTIQINNESGSFEQWFENGGRDMIIRDLAYAGEL